MVAKTDDTGDRGIRFDGRNPHQLGGSGNGIELITVGDGHTRLLLSVNPDTAFPTLHTGFRRIGSLDAHVETALAVVHSLGSKLASLLLVTSVDAGQVMVLRLHGPDGVASAAEGLRGVFSCSGVDEQGLPVGIDDEAAHIVVVVALVIVPALHGQEEGATACGHHLQPGQPTVVEQWFVYGFPHQLLHRGQQEEFAPQRRPVTALVEDGGGIVCKVLALGQIGGITSEGGIPEGACHGIDDVELVGNAVGVGIGEVDAVALTDIHLIGIGGHGLQFGLAVEWIGIGGGTVELVYAVIERGGSPVPVVSTLITTAIIGIGRHKGIHGHHDLLHGFHLAASIALVEQHTAEPVGTDPGVPVHAGRLPPVVVSECGLQDAAFDVVIHPLANHGRNLVELFSEEIGGPCHESCSLGIEEIDILVFGPGHRRTVMGRQSPPFLFERTP